MDKTDTSNNGTEIESLNTVNSPQPEQVSCPFYSVVPHENTVVKNLPLLKPATEPQDELPVIELSADSTQQDWVAEPDSDQQTQIDSEFHKLLTLNEELRTANSDLYEQVEHLKKELGESEKVLQWQKTRSSVTESMLNQQTQEISAAQEQINSLFQQLETAVQTVQHQEIFIENYKSQLQLSQQRLAQLERECSLLQNNYSEQSQQLLQSETACRELRTRLMRQQRQTLQFKSALEKCLETTVPSYDTLDDAARHPHNMGGGQTRFSRKARSLFPNAQPIQPWSAEPESLHDQHNWGESPTPPPPIPEDTETPVKPTASPQVEDSQTTPETVSSGGTAKLDQQLESLIEMFFTSQEASKSTELPIEETNSAVWDTVATSLVDDEKTQTPSEQFVTGINPPVINYTSWPIDSTISPISDIPVSPSFPQTKIIGDETEDYWLEVSPLPQLELPKSDLSPESFGEYAADSKSPSPVVYPERPPKGRKSLAAVELPNFRPKGN
jgi:hypothetical protein